MAKLKYGVGIDDSNYQTTKSEYVEGELTMVWACPYYRKWSNMLKRCYSKTLHEKYPTYKDCTVCEEWLTFSNFRFWMGCREWEGLQLDKDLLVEGNKVYSPETCVFVHHKVNTFTEDRLNGRGSYLLGCSAYYDGSFMAECNNPLQTRGNGVSNKIGTYSTEIEAHLSWKKQKHSYSCELANSKYVTDERVKNRLLTRYKNYNILEDHIK